MDEKKRKCPYCGRDLVFEEDICPYCGKKIRTFRFLKLLCWMIPLLLLATPVFIAKDVLDARADRLLHLGEPEYVKEIREEYPDLTRKQAEAMYELQWYTENVGGGHYALILYLEDCGFRESDAYAVLDALEAEEGIDWHQQAVLRARDKLEYGTYSRDLLIDQLQREDYFSEENALEAVDSLNIDWMEMSVEMAKRYLEDEPLSYAGLQNRMESEMFPEDQIQYAVENCGADWTQNACEMLQVYLEFDGWSREELYEALMLADGFTEEQARYAVENTEIP